jgi:REP element-mobilizing transposase RayT
MPRTARKISESGIYHVMLRGINRQQIFYEEADYVYFIKLLSKYKKESGYNLFAYCLMGNHVHLLIRVQKEPLSLAMKRIADSFVYWYNGKYERTGHLFQDRFKSEVIDCEQYFIAALRYILRNPVVAGLCKSPDEYAFSSGREYLCGETGISDTEYAYSLLTPTSLAEFVSINNDDKFLEIDDTIPVRLTDDKATEMILEEFRVFKPAVGKPDERQNLYLSIRKLIRRGISIRQLSRLTGISKKIIEKALKYG